MKSKIESSVTILIKTFERHNCLIKLISSIREYYKNIKICVCDDSYHHKPIYNVEYFALPYNCGTSFGRNFLVSKVRTKYLLMLDDDFIFNDRTNLNTLMEILEEYPIDLIAGDIIEAGKNPGLRRIGTFHLERKELFIERGTFHKQFEYFYLCDYVPNFFMSTKNCIEQIGGWDASLKGQEHWAFFFKAWKKIKIAFCPEVRVIHHREMTTNYLAKNNNIASSSYFRKLGKKMYDLDKVTVKHNDEVIIKF
jgi:glycosyltransferase involved in cell wall biosynthesis